MITLYVEDLNTEITQDIYDGYINQIDVHHLECTCQRHDMVIHGYYTRNLRIHDHTISLKILRVRCNSCHHTHAILLSSIVPYQSIALNIQIQIIRENDVKLDESQSDLETEEDNMIYNPDIGPQIIYRILKRFRSKFKAWISLKRLIWDSSLSIHAYQDFKSNFMQTHKGRYILNLNTT